MEKLLRKYPTDEHCSRRKLFKQGCRIAELEQYIAGFGGDDLKWLLAAAYEEMGHDLLTCSPAVAEGYYRLAHRTYSEMENSDEDRLAGMRHTAAMIERAYFLQLAAAVRKLPVSA